MTFDIDANGILNVAARDKGTGKEQSIRIEASTGLSDEEIEKMKQEAKLNEAADVQRKEEAEKVNNADSLIFQTEKMIKEYGEKLPAEKLEPINAALAELKTQHEKRDMAGMEAASQTLNEAVAGIYEDIQKAQAAEQGGAPEGGAAPDGAEEAAVKDVDFEEVEEV